MDFITRGATRLLVAEDIEEGTVRYIAESIDIRQVGYRDWITARSPDANEQTFFGLAHDATVFEIFRTAFDQTGTPLRVTVTVFPPTAISSSSTSATYQTPTTRPIEPTARTA